MISGSDLRRFRNIATKYSKVRYGRAGLLGMLDSILDILRMAGNIADSRPGVSGSGVSQEDIEAARRILQDVTQHPGMETVVDPEMVGTTEGVQAPQPPGAPQPLLSTSPSYRTRAPSAPPKEGEHHPFSEEILTPQSSNVFAFSYDFQSSTLYVTYKAPTLNAGKVGTKVNRSGLRQLTGQRGVLSGRSNSRGPMYAYYDVPARVYNRMILVGSKGKFVWDELRIRGTIWGHKYRYSLVQGAIVTQKDVSGTYIPRRATRRGLRVRAVPVVGQGRRQYQTSTLPQALRHR